MTVIQTQLSVYFYLLESPNAEAKDEESQLVALLCGDVLDGDQGRAQVGISRVKVEMFRTFHTRPGPGVIFRNKKQLRCS